MALDGGWQSLHSLNSQCRSPSDATVCESRLDRFVAGPENALAANLIQRLDAASGPAEAHLWFDPIVVYGAASTGKTHLVHVLAEAWRAQHAEADVVCVTIGELLSSYTKAMETRSLIS